MALGMRQHQIVGHRRDDDAGHDRHVQIGVGQPRQPAGLAGFRDLLGAGFGALVEIDPPHRDAAEQGRHESADTWSLVHGRSAKVAPVTTMDSPSAMMMKPAQRSAMWPPSTTQSATDDAPYFGTQNRTAGDTYSIAERHRPQHQPRLPLARSRRRSRTRPTPTSQTRMRTRIQPRHGLAGRRRCQQEDRAPDLHRAIGQREPEPARFKGLRDRGRQHEPAEHQRKQQHANRRLSRDRASW